MGQSRKRKKQLQRERMIQHRGGTEMPPPDQDILNSIGSPNAWTPAVEDAWLKELHKIPVGEIYSRFPPMKKPGNVSLRGKNNGG
ncbi:hypothetical protein LCGC14_0426680 [marine sediment metagenome]|uniref:Uncharacterized protein n=1 Tax=marine sediment metagenome TaxID=412755 RepID=A0A0F9T7G3_9ZZZZ